MLSVSALGTWESDPAYTGVSKFTTAMSFSTDDIQRVPTRSIAGKDRQALAGGAPESQYSLRSNARSDSDCSMIIFAAAAKMAHYQIRPSGQCR